MSILRCLFFVLTLLISTPSSAIDQQLMPAPFPVIRTSNSSSVDSTTQKIISASTLRVTQIIKLSIWPNMVTMLIHSTNSPH